MATKASKEAHKTGQTYKVTCGSFQSRNEALQKAAEAKRSGVNTSLALEKGKYVVLIADKLTEMEAEAIRKATEERGVHPQVTK